MDLNYKCKCKAFSRDKKIISEKNETIFFFIVLLKETLLYPPS